MRVLDAWMFWVKQHTCVPWKHSQASFSHLVVCHQGHTETRVLSQQCYLFTEGKKKKKKRVWLFFFVLFFFVQNLHCVCVFLVFSNYQFWKLGYCHCFVNFLVFFSFGIINRGFFEALLVFCLSGLSKSLDSKALWSRGPPLIGTVLL